MRIEILYALMLSVYIYIVDFKNTLHKIPSIDKYEKNSIKNVKA